MRESETQEVDVVVVGAGFGGLYMLYRLLKMGLSVKVLEKGSGVGGTWYWNRYPGARCDVESMEYSYQFSNSLEQEWEWTERYAGQREILEYLNHVADRFDLRPHILFECEVASACFNDDAMRWEIVAGKENFSSRFCVMATGNLSSTNTPSFEGIESFQGEIYHTGSWPHDAVDFTNKRIGIIGTGSSAIQATPVIAPQAKDLHVFQRTPNFSVPAKNHPLAKEVQDEIKRDYSGLRARARALPIACFMPPNPGKAVEALPEEREEVFEEKWERGGLTFLGSFSDIATDPVANEYAAEFIREKIRGIVKDPDTADLLCPDHVVGCKRPCSDTGYYEAFNRSNVHLVDVARHPIEKLTSEGLKTSKRSYELDMIIFATGFDAMTGALDNINIVGRNGETLKDKWEAGPRTYLGVATAGFPNFFTITGPGSPSVLANMVTGVEQHAEWIADCISYLDSQGHTTVEPSLQAEDDWVEHVNLVADKTLYPTCNSWYLGANIPGKPRVFMPYIGGWPAYEKKCKEVVEGGYLGFEFN